MSESSEERGGTEATTKRRWWRRDSSRHEPEMALIGPVDPADAKAKVVERYKQSIRYYNNAATKNSRAYKRSRRLVVVFGAVLTLIASLASASFVSDRAWLDTIFAVATPVLAAVLAIITGLSQSFQWGSAWRAMVLAELTQKKHLDRIELIAPDDLDAAQELERLNQTVLGETRQFFERVTGAVNLREEPRDEQSTRPQPLPEPNPST